MKLVLKGSPLVTLMGHAKGYAIFLIAYTAMFRDLSLVQDTPVTHHPLIMPYPPEGVSW